MPPVLGSGPVVGISFTTSPCGPVTGACWSGSPDLATAPGVEASAPYWPEDAPTFPGSLYCPLVPSPLVPSFKELRSFWASLYCWYWSENGLLLGLLLGLLNGGKNRGGRLWWPLPPLPPL